MPNMQDIRNADGRLIARYCPDTNVLEILVKGCLTSVHILPNKGIKVSNVKYQK